MLNMSVSAQPAIVSHRYDQVVNDRNYIFPNPETEIEYEDHFNLVDKIEDYLIIILT